MKPAQGLAGDCREDAAQMTARIVCDAHYHDLLGVALRRAPKTEQQPHIR